MSLFRCKQWRAPLFRWIWMHRMLLSLADRVLDGNVAHLNRGTVRHWVRRRLVNWSLWFTRGNSGMRF